MHPILINIPKKLDEMMYVLHHLVPKYGKSLVVLQLDDDDEEEEMMYQSKKSFHDVLPQHKALLYSQLHPDHNDAEDVVVKFFNSPDEGVLFTDPWTVTGMEADVMICFTDFVRGVHRDVMMRTISDVYFVMMDNQEWYERLVRRCGFKAYDICD